MSVHNDVLVPPQPDEHEADDHSVTSDTFEDAQDTASVRSLTKRAAHQSGSPQTDNKSELEQAFQRIRGRKSTNETEDGEHIVAPTNGEAHDEVHDETNGEANGKANGEAIGEAHTETNEDVPSSEVDNDVQSNGVAAAVVHQRKPSAIPNIDVSNTALDNVSLDDDAEAATKNGSDDIPPPPPAKETKSKLGGFTIPWSPAGHSTDKPLPISPSLPPVPPAGAPPPAPTRKLTAPFSWLSRGSSHKEPPSPSPPASVSATSARRNTASSVTTLTSNPEMMLSKLEEEGANGTGKPSLKDRFKLIRMREEAGITALPTEEGGEDEEGTPEAPGSPGKTATALAVPAEGEQPPASPIPSSPNPDLAPGTVSGVTAGPSTMADAPVDWDLWQAVIYEGPAAVARSSPEELNKAIATGIPNAVRGVIWQVLAQSKNEELEAVYQTLVDRGTDKERKSSVASHKDAPSSSASSVHSADTGKESGGGIAASTTSAEKEENAAARKKKDKEDAVALHKLDKTIRRDLGARTSYSKFAAAQGLQEGLYGVCKAYALYDEGVGYAQGMNFLIMPLLFNMPADEAFCLLVRLMNQYHLRDLFIHDMPGLHKNLYLFERLLEDLEPALYCHLHRKGISPHLYATQWFLTLFAYRFPLQLVLRIYDVILSEGLAAILKFGIVLMQKNATTLLGISDMAQLTTFLKDRLFDVYIDVSPSAGSILENGFFGSSSSSLDKEVYRADQFVRDACEVKLTPELIQMYTTEWEEKTQAEKAREEELEHLRTSNNSLTIKVRRLEEDVELLNREQTSLATDLVRVKVENEELQDQNESLKGQVKELKVVIEKQPEELEQAWQLERDDLMNRNSKVHEENQRVSKELEELEEQLVKTKMEYAEVNSQYETLTRKWAELKRHFV